MTTVLLLFLTCFFTCHVIGDSSRQYDIDGQGPSNDAILRQVLTHFTRNNNYYNNLLLNDAIAYQSTPSVDKFDSQEKSADNEDDDSGEKIGDVNSTEINKEDKMAESAEIQGHQSYPPTKLDGKSVQTKDHEYLGQSSLWGNQYISGGAGEGKQHLVGPNGDKDNHQEIKTDPDLPGYCSPPNPCPKGYTAQQDGCQEHIPDTVSFNRRYNYMQLARGSCSCDSEHMFNCPAGYDKIASQQKSDQTSDPIDVLVERLLSGGDDEKENPYARGVKRNSMVAKKFRTKREAINHMHFQRNSNRHIVVAKKGRSPYIPRS